jgi:signal transduction histidine kinase
MGMGLYMSKLIVEAHGGRIECLDRVGGGTRFEIRIPKAHAA